MRSKHSGREGTRDRANVRMGYGLQDILNESISPIQVTTISNFQDIRERMFEVNK